DAPAVGGFERSGVPNVTPSPTSDGSGAGVTSTGRPTEPPITWSLVSPLRITIERWKPDEAWSGSISAIAPFVRMLLKARKLSFRFGAVRQIALMLFWPLSTDVT